MARRKTKKDLIKFLTDTGSRGTAPGKSMEDLLDEVALFKQMRPFLKQINKEVDEVITTGRTGTLMKKMADYGSLVLLALMHTTDNDKLKFEVVREVMNRAYGRPTEKHISVKIPLDQMDEEQINALIRSEAADNKELFKEILDVTPKKEK